MHPIERLRYVARSSGAPMSMLVRETAGALGGLGFDPAGLVVGRGDQPADADVGRRVDRQDPTGGLEDPCALVREGVEHDEAEVEVGEPLGDGVPFAHQARTGRIRGHDRGADGHEKSSPAVIRPEGFLERL